MPTPQFILDLRQQIGHDPLWLIGATGVIWRGVQDEYDMGSCPAHTGGDALAHIGGERPGSSLAGRRRQQSFGGFGMRHIGWARPLSAE